MKNRIAEDRKQTVKKKGKGGGTGKRPPAAAQDLASPNTRLLLDLHDAQHGNTHVSSPEATVFQLGAPVKGEKIAPIRGGLFVYHGDELSPPPEDIAMAYATHIPLKKGMPGPSFTWSCYAQSVEEAIEGLQVQEKPNPLSLSAPLSLPQLQSYRISPVVTERLDESLIVLSSHLSWSVADLVNVMPRKVSPCLLLLQLFLLLPSRLLLLLSISLSPVSVLPPTPLLMASRSCQSDERVDDSSGGMAFL
jgi:hypothetical protein